MTKIKVVEFTDLELIHKKETLLELSKPISKFDKYDKVRLIVDVFNCSDIQIRYALTEKTLSKIDDGYSLIQAINMIAVEFNFSITCNELED